MTTSARPHRAKRVIHPINDDRTTWIGGEHHPFRMKPKRPVPQANVCGQPYVLQIRSYFSQFGERSPASISR